MNLQPNTGSNIPVILKTVLKLHQFATKCRKQHSHDFQNCVKVASICSKMPETTFSWFSKLCTSCINLQPNAGSRFPIILNCLVAAYIWHQKQHSTHLKRCCLNPFTLWRCSLSCQTHTTHKENSLHLSMRSSFWKGCQGICAQVQAFFQTSRQVNRYKYFCCSQSFELSE